MTDGWSIAYLTLIINVFHCFKGIQCVAIDTKNNQVKNYCITKICYTIKLNWILKKKKKEN